MRNQGRWYSILVQSPPFNLSSHLLPSPVTAANLAGAGLPELWGVCPGTRYRHAAVGQWSLDKGVAGTIYPCPAENTSHFPTAQDEPVDPDRPPTTQSSHISDLYTSLLQYVVGLPAEKRARLCSTLLCLRGV